MKQTITDFEGKNITADFELIFANYPAGFGGEYATRLNECAQRAGYGHPIGHMDTPDIVRAKLLEMAKDDIFLLSVAVSFGGAELARIEQSATAATLAPIVPPRRGIGRTLLSALSASIGTHRLRHN